MSFGLTGGLGEEALLNFLPVHQTSRHYISFYGNTKKTKVYATKPATVANLSEAIEYECA